MNNKQQLRLQIKAKNNCKIRAVLLDQYSFGYIFYDGINVITAFTPGDSLYSKGYIRLLAEYAE